MYSITAVACVGLALAAYGAYVAAKGTILRDVDIAVIAQPLHGPNPTMIKALQEQSAAARKGLLLMAAGSLMQMVATVFQAIPGLAQLLP